MRLQECQRQCTMNIQFFLFVLTNCQPAQPWPKTPKRGYPHSQGCGNSSGYFCWHGQWRKQCMQSKNGAFQNSFTESKKLFNGWMFNQTGKPFCWTHVERGYFVKVAQPIQVTPLKTGFAGPTNWFNWRANQPCNHIIQQLIMPWDTSESIPHSDEALGKTLSVSVGFSTASLCVT